MKNESKKMKNYIMQSVILLLGTLHALVNSQQSYIVNTFEDPDNIAGFNHIVKDESTGNLYIGSTNTIYELNNSLLRLQKVSSGPLPDNPKCLTPDSTCQEDRVSTNAVTKAMVIDSSNRRLIVCYNLYQGFCERRDLNDINVKDQPSFTGVVANDVSSSAVLLVAPGRIKDQDQQSNVLYVAAERSVLAHQSSYQDGVYALSTRHLNDFSLSYQDSFKKSSVQVDNLWRDTFRIRYITGFTHNGFSYFVAVQKADTSAGNYITKLIRVCQKDGNGLLRSYVEVPLKCTNSGTTYNIARAAVVAKPGQNLFDNLNMNTHDNDKALFVLFSTSASTDSSEPSSVSAMCVYKMWDIQSKFTANIRHCFSGSGNTGPNHLTSSTACSSLDLNLFPVGDDYCGDVELNFPIGSNSLPITSAAVITWNTAVTAVAVTSTSTYTVAFVGTENGHIKKVVVETANSATEYDDITVDEGNAINPNLLFGEQGHYLFVTTVRKVTQIKVEECRKYQSCSQCVINARDPYCGWCSLESKCSVFGQCVNADQPQHWLSYNNNQCTEITGVSPSQIQIESDSTNLRLAVNIQNLPSVTGASYYCAFYPAPGGTPLVQNAYKTATGVTCYTPPRSNLPNIPTGSDHITMQLAVRTNDQDFVAINFSFFNCALHESCTSCTKSLFPCTWCVRQHKCTSNRESCGSDVLVTGENVPGTSQREGPEQCPRITLEQNEILVPSGTSKVISVNAQNLQNFQENFRCAFTFSWAEEVSSAARQTSGSDRIECTTPVKFEYSVPSPSQLVPFQITWRSSESQGQRHPLDNPKNIQVKVYKCQEMSVVDGTANCGNCLTLDPAYHCGWCQQSMSCTIQSQCEANWLVPTSHCPNPQIRSIHPSSGPMRGGTKLTIRGINLGKGFNDIFNGVDVGNIPCTVIEDEYVKTSKIVCTTGQVSGDTSDTLSLKVSVKIGNRYTATSVTKFSYVHPKVNDFQPKRGIQEGGTRITITGEHLNAGTSITAEFGTLPCIINSTSEKIAVCTTSKHTRPENVSFDMQFDDEKVLAFNLRYEYTRNPNISSFGRGYGYKLGGLNESIVGNHFQAVQEPKMFIEFDGKRYIEACKIITNTKMTCVTPAVNLDSVRRKRAVSAGTTELTYGIIMEALETFSSDKIVIYPNPEFDEFEGGEMVISKLVEKLTIIGRNLVPVLTKNDVEVAIGSQKCIVNFVLADENTDIAGNQKDEIQCSLPPLQEGVNVFPVKVIVGNNRNSSFVIGDLKYEDEEILPFWAYIILGAGGFIMLVVIIVVVIAYHRKSQQSDMQVQHMQHQMDVLETKVAKECKEAFAELQTDMTEMTSDLTGLIGMPFLDYRSYSMRVLFPNCDEYDHPVVKELEVDYCRQESLERGLRMFGQLMNNKTFLLLFIRTLEADKHFSMRERVNVASLVSVALQGKMEYMTDILKTLLAELIEKSVEGKSHPKLLLRRTESVAEKMLTNWFTYLLHKFLKECAGEPLFMLFRAIKQQVEKGPIDAITGEAKYSLSEDKLIRQQLDYKGLTINVIEVDSYHDQMHPVKVLDCDSISQVKEKILDAIYKNAPYSSRHSKDELDLEWHTGVQGRMILQDEDKTMSKSEDGLRQLNTLSHYKVADGAVMALVTKQQQYNHSVISEKSTRNRDTFDTAFMTSSPSMSRMMSPNSSNLDVESGSKLFHLVKPHDSDVQKEGERGSKMVSEIYLTRLLATKGTLQQFVDDLFETIFSTAHRGSALPLAIKYMFDFLDDQALLHGITDLETVHTWKSNSLPLRFWVNVIKNPNFVFDVYKSSIVDSCLSVVAQTFMDSCSMSDHRLGKDSPATKLLYAKDIPKYKKWVERYYQDIKLMPAISDQDMNALLAEESRMHQSEFNTIASLNELYQYAVKYNDQLLQTLEEDEFARKNRLAHRLEQVTMCMDTSTEV